jgi:hypothetical protein
LGKLKSHVWPAFLLSMVVFDKGLRVINMQHIQIFQTVSKRDRRFGSATFVVSLQDFSRVGDTAVFMDDASVDFVEQQMMERGYLDSREMANMFQPSAFERPDLVERGEQLPTWPKATGLRPPLLEQRWHADGPRST